VTFYLKYRPQTINELDLKGVREQLSVMLGSGKLPHAFLFSGPRGLGKTSAARILAKAVNCLQFTAGRKKKLETGDRGLAAKDSGSRKLVAGSFYEPCNKCDVCKSITSGTAMDLIEIDAASNRGIDDIRALREKIKSSPVSLAKKVYVIDEVHMLTKEAFNALLKTLEEPPEHALFILATTEPQKLPETIISRCTHIKFRKATNEELVRSLKRIVKGEKLKVGKGVLVGIAKKADGSFRDATKILEQLSFLGKKITKKQVKDLKADKSKGVFSEALTKRDAEQALQLVKALSEEGIDWKDFLMDFLEDLRAAILAHFSIVKSEIEGFSLEELKELVRLFSRAAVELKSALVPELPIELAIIEYCDSDREKKNHKSQITNHKSPDKLVPSHQPPAENKKSIKRDNNRAIKQSSNNTNKGSKTPNPTIDLSEVEKKWNDVLKHVKPQNHSIEALLRSCKPKNVRGRSVIVEVFYAFHKGRLETEKCRVIVEKALQKVLNNKELRVSYILGQTGSQPSPRLRPAGRQPAASPQQRKNIDKSDEELEKNVEEVFGSS